MLCVRPAPLVLALALVGCAEADPEALGRADGGPDSAAEATSDATSDTASIDAKTDATTDAGPDTPKDTSTPTDATPDTTDPDTTTDTGADTGPLDTGTADTATDTGATDTGTPDGAVSIGWSTTATDHRCTTGVVYTYVCPSGGTFGSVWGTGDYTDDSSICTAAVHAGRLTTAGGTVSITMGPGLSSYTGSTAHGVTSSSYGSWLCSYAFVGGADAGTDAVVDAPPDAETATWTTSATAHRCKIGETFAYTCPAGGSASTIWGTGDYTDDSSVCTAAVHQGKITLASGGVVTIEMRAGLSAYTASTAFGVTSNSYGSWTCSFAVK